LILFHFGIYSVASGLNAYFCIMWYNNILETIGNTPLVKLNTITKDVKATVLAKIETTNPGNSIKDRMAVKMIEDAEREGKLKPGGTIIEGTSGNTGMGLAMAAIIKGYKCIFTTTDKQSKEKVDALRAFGQRLLFAQQMLSLKIPAHIIQFLHVWSARCRIHGNLTNTIISLIRRLIMSKQVLRYGSKQREKSLIWL
jgi:hypothetical protein